MKLLATGILLMVATSSGFAETEKQLFISTQVTRVHFRTGDGSQRIRFNRTVPSWIVGMEILYDRTIDTIGLRLEAYKHYAEGDLPLHVEDSNSASGSIQFEVSRQYDVFQYLGLGIRGFAGLQIRNIDEIWMETERFTSRELRVRYLQHGVNSRYGLQIYVATPASFARITYVHIDFGAEISTDQGQIQAHSDGTLDSNEFDIAPSRSLLISNARLFFRFSMTP
jgi:hypothetical protein